MRNTNKLAVVLISLMAMVLPAKSQDTVRRAGVEDLKYKSGTFTRPSRLISGNTITLNGFTPINVLAFGVDNTGATSCAESLQAAIDSLEAWGGGDLYFPFGSYDFTGVTIASDSVSVFGPGVPDNLPGGAPRVMFGTKSPVSAIQAPRGSMYLRGGDADSIIYYKASGDNATGWVCDNIETTVSLAALSDSLDSAHALIDTLLYSDPFNVKRYGAVGDSTTDDGAAILAAITAASAAGGGTVVFPAGTYGMDSSIICTNIDNVTIRGDGATIIANAPVVAAMFAFNSCNNITIQSMRIDGNDLGHWGFDFKGCSNLLIQDVEIFDIEQQPATGNYAAGIRVGNYAGEGGQNISIRDCYIHDIESTVSNASRGIVFYTFESTSDVYVRDITISGCTIEDIVPVTDGDGIVFQQTNTAGATLGIPINASVTGCRFYNCHKRGVKIQNEGVSVVGNQFYTNRTGTWVSTEWVGFQYSGVSIYEGNCVVSNNTFMATGGGAFQYGVDTDGGTRTFQNVVISNNTVQNDTTSTVQTADPWQQAYGFRIGRADVNGTTHGVVLSGNSVFATKYAYWVGLDVDNVNLTGNVNRYATTAALLVSTPTDTISGLTIHGNTFNGALTIGALLNKTSVQLSGPRTPEGVIQAPAGTLYLRSSDVDSLMWVKEADNDATGWVMK